LGKVTEILEYLENNIDTEHIEKVKNDLRRTLDFLKPDRLPLQVDCPCEKFAPYPYLEAYEDMEKMMYNELLSTVKAIEVKDYTLPMLRANYGVGILPSLFGLNCRIVNNNLPWVDHVGTLDAVKKIIDKGIPDLRSGLGARVFETQSYYSEQLSNYPKCKEYIKVYHPDLQGPFDVSHLIWGPDIYYALYDDPDTVHELLGLVTATYIAFLKELKKTLNDEEDGFCFHWGKLFKGSVVIRDDSPVNLSPDMYKEFVKPYDDRILKEFAIGSIHYCGRADQWIFEMMESEGLEAMNFGQPPNIKFGFDFLEKIYPRMKEKKIANIGYHMNKELLPDVMKSEFTTGITYNTIAVDKDEAINLIKLTEFPL
jgi:uroporphyrinogen-III decarboxylase